MNSTNVVTSWGSYSQDEPFGGPSFPNPSRNYSVITEFLKSVRFLVGIFLVGIGVLGWVVTKGEGDGFTMSVFYLVSGISLIIWKLRNLPSSNPPEYLTWGRIETAVGPVYVFVDSKTKIGWKVLFKRWMTDKDIELVKKWAESGVYARAIPPNPTTASGIVNISLETSEGVKIFPVDPQTGFVYDPSEGEPYQVSTWKKILGRGK